MLLTPDKAVELLLDLFKQHEELDSASVAVLWLDKLRTFEHDTITAVQRQLPHFYTIQHGTLVNQSSDGDYQFSLYTPDARYRVLAEDLPQFARQHNIPFPVLMDVLNGDELDVNGYRSYWNQNSMSRLYQPPRDVSEDDYIADLKEARRLNKRPVARPYSSPTEPVEQDWSK